MGKNPHFSTISLVDVEAVSYTHLDVYKRQELYCIDLSKKLFTTLITINQYPGISQHRSAV